MLFLLEGRKAAEIYPKMSEVFKKKWGRTYKQFKEGRLMFTIKMDNWETLPSVVIERPPIYKQSFITLNTFSLEPLLILGCISGAQHPFSDRKCITLHKSRSMRELS